MEWFEVFKFKNRNRKVEPNKFCKKRYRVHNRDKYLTKRYLYGDWVWGSGIRIFPRLKGGYYEKKLKWFCLSVCGRSKEHFPWKHENIDFYTMSHVHHSLVSHPPAK